MSSDRCPACDALYVLVGYRHRCIPRAKVEPVKVKAAPKAAAPAKTKTKPKSKKKR